MSSFMDAFNRLQMMMDLNAENPDIEKVMEYGFRAGIMQDEEVREHYFEIYGKEQWEALKKKHGIKTSRGPKETDCAKSNDPERKAGSSDEKSSKQV